MNISWAMANDMLIWFNMYMGVSENGVVYSKVPKLDILNGENGDKSLEFAGLGLDNRMSWTNLFRF